MRHLHLDWETASGIDLIGAGSWKYARHESTRVLLGAWAFDSGPVKQWAPAEGEMMPSELEDALQDPSVIKFAWNSTFERDISQLTLGIETPIKQWRDVQIMALYCSLPAGLAKCGPVVNLPEELLKKAGSHLIKVFSTFKKKWYEDPTRWREFRDYNIQDVDTERAIYRKLLPFDMPASEWSLWHLDQVINERGIPIDLPSVRNIIKIRDHILGEDLAEMKELTGLGNPNSNQQLLTWLEDRGYPWGDLTAKNIKKALNREQAWDDSYTRVLELRQRVSRTSTKKYDAVVSHIDEDGRLRHCHQFNGAARTHRWAGRIIQPQNMKTPLPGMDSIEWGETDGGNPIIVGGTQIETTEKLGKWPVGSVKSYFEDPMAAMASGVRPIIAAPLGYIFVVFDFAAVEYVAVGWVSGDEKILDVCEQGRDPYIDFATHMYKEPYEDLLNEYKAGGKKKRTVSKPAVLGCGYGLGKGEEHWNEKTGEYEASGLLGYGRNMGVDLTPGEAEAGVEVYRGTYTGVTDFWEEIEDAAFKCVKDRTEIVLDHLSFDYKAPFLRMNLPSGTSLHYCRPRIESKLKPWGKWKMTLTYEGQNDRKQWVRIQTYYGKLTENAVQKIARDLLANSIKLVENHGIPIVMHVHDEGVWLVKEEYMDEAYRVIRSCMKAASWAPDMPVTASGYISKRFVKD